MALFFLSVGSKNGNEGIWMAVRIPKDFRVTAAIFHSFKFRVTEATM